MPEDDGGRTLPEHVTLPLLALVTQQSLDQDYRHVAERRASGRPAEGGSRAPGLAALAVLALFGALVATAAAQESRDAVVDATSRSVLIDQIDQRRNQLAEDQDRIGRLRARISVLEAKAADTSAAQQATGTRVERLLVRTGYGPVHGPGVRIVVDDSPSGIPEQAVRDTDLADLVNALWSVGAEAIAINGERLTVLSSIRNVDVAIHVNGRPVDPPYVVEAIGDPRTLQADLANSSRGAAFLALAEVLGLEVTPSNQSDLTLPGATLRPLRSARAADGDNGGTRIQKEATS